MLTDISFAERIIEKYKYFGRYRLFAPTFVFAREERGTYTHQVNRTVWMKLQIGLSEKLYGQKKETIVRRELVKMIVQDIRTRDMHGEWKTKLVGEITTMKRTVNTYLKHTQILDLVKTAVLSPVWKQPQLVGQVRTLAGWETAHRLEQYYRERDAALLPPAEDEMHILRTGKQAVWYEERRDQIIKRQKHQQEEFVQAINRVSHLEERMELQEQVLRELRRQKQTLGQLQRVPREQIDNITKAVVKNMERELHLEKLRRGLY